MAKGKGKVPAAFLKAEMKEKPGMEKKESKSLKAKEKKYGMK